MREGPHDCPLTLLLHEQAPSPVVVTELPPPQGALGQEQSSSAFEASLHPSLGGSAQSEPGAGWAGYWGLAPGIAILRRNQINNEC